jgi:PAS domain S-box-containing protein
LAIFLDWIIDYILGVRMQSNQLEIIRNAMMEGDSRRARSLVVEMLERDPENEIAWLTLSLLVREERKKIYCLERVQSLDSQSRVGRIARAWLSKLDPSTYPNDPNYRSSHANHPHGLSSSSPNKNQQKNDIEVDLEPFYEDLRPVNDREVGLDGVHGWTWRCNTRGEYQHCSSEVVEVLGSSPKKFVGKPLQSFHMNPHSREAVEKALREESNPTQVSAEFRSVDGSVVPVQLHILPVLDQKGDFKGWHGFAEVTHIFDPHRLAMGNNSEPTERDLTKFACPLLGLSEDPFTYTMYPNEDHRCYRPSVLLPVEFSYQTKYCLSEEHNNCSIYLNGLGTDIPEIIGGSNLDRRVWTVDRKLLVTVLIILAVMFIVIITLIIYLF